MERLHHGLTVPVGASSVGIGLYIIYEIGIIGGLLVT